MDRQQAQRRYGALRNMVVARGCTPHEAETAARLARVLAAKWGFDEYAQQRPERNDFDTRFGRAERAAATRWAWEYRRCGKARCHCMRTNSPHGPYKYGKKRRGKKVVSIYVGK